MSGAAPVAAAFTHLAQRGVVAVAGPDARTFLQGLVSNDVNRVADDRVVWTALLTPQGRFLHEFTMAVLDGGLVLDCEAARRDDLIRRLNRYRLRAKVTLTDRTGELGVYALFGEEAAGRLGLPEEAGAATPFAGGMAWIDPRRSDAGARAVLPLAGAPVALAAAGFAEAAADDWERRRIACGLPDGSRDMTVEKALLLENGFDELNGVAWDKGCYVGQELTARTRYRGLTKRRLVPVRVEGPLPAAGTPVVQDGKEVGEIRSGVAGLALASLRLEALERKDAALTAAAARITPCPAAPASD